MAKINKASSGRWGWRILGALAVCAVVASTAWWLRGNTYWTDGRTLRVAATEARLREVLWMVPRSLEDSLNSADQQYEPTLSPDGTELYFVRGKPGSNAHIYVSCRQGNQWTRPEPVAFINSSYDDLGPRLTADGRFLLFYSNRPGGFGGYDIWAADRTDHGWDKPFNLGPAVNSEFNEYSPDPTPDGKHLIFATNRKAASQEQVQAWQSTIRESATADYDLWIADRDEEVHQGRLPSTQPATQAAMAPHLRFSATREIPDLNTPWTEGASCISPAGDFLYFASNRPGGYGKFDIYRCRVHDNVFGNAENLGPTINGPGNDADPALALEGYRLYFSSDRGNPQGVYALMSSDSREVYSRQERAPLPRLGWSAWSLLISTVILIPLLLLLRGWQSRPLPLLQRCLLLSLLLHAIVTFASSFWIVTQEVTRYVRKQAAVDSTVSLAVAKDVEIGLAIRSQTSSDLPVSTVPPTSLRQMPIALDRSRTLGQVELYIPQAAPTPSSGGSDPVLAPIRSQMNSTAPTVSIEARMPDPVAIETHVGARSRISVPEIVSEPAFVAVATSKAIPTGSSSVAPWPIEIAVTPSAPGANGGEAIDGPAPSIRPPAPSPVPIPAADAGAAMAPFEVNAPALTQPLRASSDPEEPSSPELRIGLSRQAVAGAGARAGRFQPNDAIPVANAEARTSLTDLPTGLQGRFTGANAGSRFAAPGPATMPAVVAPLIVPPQIADAGPKLPFAQTRPTFGEGNVADAGTDSTSLAPGNSLGGNVTRRWATAQSTGSQDALLYLPMLPTPPGDSGRIATGIPSAVAGPPPAVRVAGNLGASVMPHMEITPLQGELGPTEHAAPPSPFPRSVEERKPLLEKMGGTEQSEDAVGRGLAYLARTQEPDGRWGLILNDLQPARRAKGFHDMACTGLAILAFLAQDHTPDKPGRYRDVVSRGLDYLAANQDEDGDLRGPEHFRGSGSSRANMYDHAIATLALAEAGLMTQDRRYVSAAIRGARFIVAAQNADTGGWRYLPNEPGDSSVLGWQIMALHSAEQLGFKTPVQTRQWIERFMALCSSGRRRMLASYQPGGAPSPAMTAQTVYARMLLGQKLTDADIAEATNFLVRQPPDLANPDLYYWYYASLCMMQVQNELWRQWNTRTREALLLLQHRGGMADGSWGSNLRWADRGGKVFTTSMAVLTLEVYYRYFPMRSGAAMDRDIR